MLSRKQDSVEETDLFAAFTFGDAPTATSTTTSSFPAVGKMPTATPKKALDFGGKEKKKKKTGVEENFFPIFQIETGGGEDTPKKGVEFDFGAANIRDTGDGNSREGLLAERAGPEGADTDEEPESLLASALSGKGKAVAGGFGDFGGFGGGGGGFDKKDAASGFGFGGEATDKKDTAASGFGFGGAATEKKDVAASGFGDAKNTGGFGAFGGFGDQKDATGGFGGGGFGTADKDAASGFGGFGGAATDKKDTATGGFGDAKDAGGFGGFGTADKKEGFGGFGDNKGFGVADKKDTAASGFGGGFGAAQTTTTSGFGAAPSTSTGGFGSSTFGTATTTATSGFESFGSPAAAAVGPTGGPAVKADVNTMTVAQLQEELEKCTKKMAGIFFFFFFSTIFCLFFFFPTSVSNR